LISAAALLSILTPQGHLTLVPAAEAAALQADVQRRLTGAFERGAGHGLLQLGAGEVHTALPAVFSYWREFGARYVTDLCTTPLPADVMRPASRKRAMRCRR
jgi:hypothetical protein